MTDPAPCSRAYAVVASSISGGCPSLGAPHCRPSGCLAKMRAW